MKDNKFVIKVIFYEIEVDDKTVQQAALICDDGISIVSKEEGYKVLNEMIHETVNANGKSLDFDDIEKLDLFEVLHEEDFINKYPDLYTKIQAHMHNENNNSQTEEQSEFKDSQDIEENDEEDYDDYDDYDDFSVLAEMIKDKLKGLKVKNVVFGAAIIFLAVTAGKCAFKLADKSESKNSKTVKTVKEETTTDIENSKENDATTEKTYQNMEELLRSANINSTKAAAIEKVWLYLCNYNQSISERYLSDSTRLAHTWDEIMIQFLTYNDLSQDDINAIFGNYNLNVDELKASYQAGFNQDVLEYCVLTDPSNKSSLFVSKESQDFYNKYEDMIIRFNRYEDISKKEEVANQFYNEIRDDFELNVAGAEIPNYKLSVLAMIKAFNTMTKDLDLEAKLTKAEKKYFNNLSDFSQVEGKISNLATLLYSHNLAQQALNEVNSEISYEDIRNLAINELMTNNLYSVEESQRDISNSSFYKNNTNLKSSKKEKSEETETTVSPNTESNSNQQKYNESTTNSSNESKDDNYQDEEKSAKIPDWMLEEEEQDTSYINNQETTENDTEIDVNEDTEYYDEEIIPVEPDTPDYSYNNRMLYNEAVANLLVENMEKVGIAAYQENHAKK